jgi:hypothetical protein
MTERDQKKLLSSGFTLVRRVLRETHGEISICFEQRTDRSGTWSMVGKNNFHFTNPQLAEIKFKEILSDPKTIEIRW